MRLVGVFPASASAVLLAVSLGLSGCDADEDPVRPDVVLIVVDTLRADRTSLYGYARPTTPVLDGFARQGALFLDHSAQSSWTLPSMVSLLSGRYLSDYRDALDPNWPVMPEAFRAAGYRTLGLSANILLMPENGFQRGFDHYDARKAPAIVGDSLDRSRSFEQLAADLEGPLAEALAPGAGGNRPPVFLFLQVFDPHDEYQAHPDFDGELPLEGVLATSKLDWQLDELARHGIEPPAGDPDWKRETRWLHWQRSLYDQEVRYTDAWIGKLVTRLAELGVGAEEGVGAGLGSPGARPCVFAVLSDHGEGLWDHAALRTSTGETGTNGFADVVAPREFFYQQHGAHLYEEALRTPFLLWGAGIPRGVRVTAPTENVDVLPTLLELAGLPLAGRVDGRSLVPLFSSAPATDPAAATAWRATTHAYVLHGVSVREVSSGLKLILPTEASKALGVGPRLFDLGTDPAERVNLADSRPGDLARLSALIAAWTAAHPTRSNLGEEKSAEQTEALGDLGYAEEHTGDDG